MAIANFHEFSSRAVLAKALATDVSQRLEPHVETGAFSSIALSGGSTPELFLNELGKLLGDTKEMVYFAMVDERFVPPDDKDSNERFIKNALGLADHPGSEFLSLFMPKVTAQQAATFAEARLIDDEELPFDVVVLGMGTDGHTASFFPGGDNLESATDPKTPRLFSTIKAPGAAQERITLTLPSIVCARRLVLHIEGEEKRAVLEEAIKNGDANTLPVRHVLRHPDAQVEVYWAP